MALKKDFIQPVAVNMLLNGWGYVEGKWVYLPLWDPAPGYKAFRALLAGAVLADATKLVASKGHAEKLKALSGVLVRTATNGLTKAWEEGDPICPPWPPHPHWPPVPFPWPQPEPDPRAIHEFVKELNPVAKNAVIGNLVAIIGEMIGDKSVMQVGNEIMAAR